MPIKESIADGNLVAEYMEFIGTHTGTFCGIKPTHIIRQLNN